MCCGWTPAVRPLTLLEQHPTQREVDAGEQKARYHRPSGLHEPQAHGLQQRVWDVHEKEAYAILLALEKWSSWIRLQLVLILNDHEPSKTGCGSTYRCQLA
jgi:hypothetical protein